MKFKLTLMALLLLAAAQLNAQQTRIVKGTVTDAANNNPLPGVTIKAGNSNTLTQSGKISIANHNPFSCGKNGFQISSLLQQKIVYVGQMDCYESCSDVLEKLSGAQVGATQIYRLTDAYGKQIEDTVNAERTLAPLKADEVLYLQADGPMVLTREDGWKEAKVGRFFKSSDCIHAAAKQGWISNSQYVVHLGSSKDFTKLMDDLIESYCSLVKRLLFISDGLPG